MGALARMAGGWLSDSIKPWIEARAGKFWASAFGRLPEILFALAIGTTAGHVAQSWIIGITATIWSYIAFEIGHGNAAHMGVAKDDFPPRHQTLDVIVLPVCKLFGWENRGWQYCWLYMGLKWLLVVAPLLPLSLPLVVLVPAGYAIVMWPQKNKEPMLRSWGDAETISGVLTGLAIAAVLIHKIILLAGIASWARLV